MWKWERSKSHISAKLKVWRISSRSRREADDEVRADVDAEFLALFHDAGNDFEFQRLVHDFAQDPLAAGFHRYRDLDAAAAPHQFKQGGVNVPGETLAAFQVRL